MRARGQGLLALALAAVVVAAGIAFDRLGPKAAGAASSAHAPSGAWFCPHGGGEGWRTVLSIANPGGTDVTVRITTLGAKAPRGLSTLVVPAGTEVRDDVPSADRGAATFVEYFGGWVSAGWTSEAGGKDIGVAAESCASRASRLWYAADNTTQLGEDAYLVIMNPFGAAAVFDVALFTTDRAPIRDSDLMDVTLRAHRSVALRLNPYVADEEAVTAEVRVTSGRATVASLGVTKGGGVRSAVGWPGTATEAFLPVAEGSGQSQMAIAVPGDVLAMFGATLFSNQPTGSVPGLETVSQDPLTARVYPLNTNGASAAYLRTLAGAQIVAALRSIGVSGDRGATGGAISTAVTWVVTPTVVGSRGMPGLVMVNPGAEPVDVTLHLLAPDGSAPAGDVTVTLPASSSVASPPGFLASAPGASVLVTSGGGGILAMGASTSQLPESVAGYALAMGVPVPSSSTP